MKAVMPDVPEHLLEWRRRTGADQWDEMWAGVLHMPPIRTVHHQDVAGNVLIYLKEHWAKSSKAKVTQVFGNMAPQTLQSIGTTPQLLGAERGAAKSFGASDVLIVMLYEAA